MTTPLKFKYQFDFVLKMITILQKPKNLTELMSELSVTERTVYRWIDHLELMGFNIERSRVFKQRVFRITNGSPELALECLKMFQMCVPKNLRYHDRTAN